MTTGTVNDIEVYSRYSPVMTRAAVYARISSDPDERKVGVDRQTADCLAIATQLGWDVVETFVDNDRSAKDGRRRPEFERMLAAVESGSVEAIVAWDDDRLARAAVDLERLIVLARARGLLTSTRHGPKDLAVAHGQLTARIKTAVADYEVTQMGERLQRAFRDRAERGLPHSFCAFGWRRAYQHDEFGRVVSVAEPLDPVNGAALQEAARLLLSGDSLRSIAADFEARGLPTPQQQSRRSPNSTARWNSTILRQLLKRDRNAGLRVHRGVVIGQASCEPLYDEATHRRVLAVLDDPTRRTSVGNGRARHLLSGIARCGLCEDGGRIVTLPSQNGRRVYVCSQCHRIRRRADPVDEWVESHVIELLSRPDAVALLSRPDDTATIAAGEVVRTLRERLDSAADQFAEGLIDARQLARVTARLRPELEAAERTVRAGASMPDLLDLAVPDADERWLEASMDRKRAAVRALVRVTILPTGRGRAAFRTDHVSVVPA